MANEPLSDARSRQLGPPLVSIAWITGLTWYVSANGLASLSPATALGLICTVSLVFMYMMRPLRRRFDNTLTAAIEGVSSFISLAAGLGFLSLTTYEQGLDKQLGHFDALLRSPTAADAFLNLGPVVGVAALVITIAALVLTLTFLVYADVFGRKRNKPR